MYHSCKNRKDNQTGRKRKQQTSREGAAGVTIAVHKSLLTQSTVKPVRIEDPAAKGHCKAVTITPPGSDRLVAWGLYIPHDREEREAVYAMLKRDIPKAEAEVTAATGKKCFTIMAGDWNAALLTGDGNVLTSRDKAHQHLMETIGITSTEDAHEIHRMFGPTVGQPQ